MEPRLPEGVHDLTDRQREVAQLVAQGLTNAEIGDRLGISLDGAKYHVSEVLTRLNLERREQIAEWVGRAGASGRSRHRWAFAAVAAALTAGAAVLVVVFVAGWSGLADGASDQPSDGALVQVGRPVIESTPEASAAGEPETFGDLSTSEMLELLYEPIPWHDARRANRVPPRSVEQAFHQDWFGYQDLYQFAGEPAEGFDARRMLGPSCLVEGVADSPVQSANWLLDLRASEGETGRYLLELTPSHPALLDIDPTSYEVGSVVSSGPPPGAPVPLRIRAVDTSNWEATHVVELWTPNPADEDGVVRLSYDAPRATRWLVVVTAGPMWGCFYLDTERDVAGWPATRSEIRPSVPEPTTDSPPPQELRTALGAPPSHGSDERVCVDPRSSSARSGEIALATPLAIWRDWPTQARTSGGPSLWVPGHPTDGAALNLRAIVDGDGLGPLHAFEVIDAGTEGRAWFDGSHPESDPATKVYRTHMLLPFPGDWSIVATVPPVNWGCFEVRVGLDHRTYR